MGFVGHVAEKPMCDLRLSDHIFNLYNIHNNIKNKFEFNVFNKIFKIVRSLYKKLFTNLKCVKNSIYNAQTCYHNFFVILKPL